MSVAFSCARLRRGGGGRAVAAVEHVRLHDPATGAAALHVREVHALGLGHAARHGRDPDAVGKDLLLLLLGLGRLGGRLGSRGRRGLRPTASARGLITG